MTKCGENNGYQGSVQQRAPKFENYNSINFWNCF